ncbi:prenyltransferase/squalene oxidase repeat-containing protein [Clostridium paraputrificum]|uniref:prenyltransferase/squalene oxidase repeat-containing protein n=1 Tax=Clostridium paraputrificum TaxID=29363 RepID=UPI003D3439F6
MKKLLSKVMAVVFVVSMLFTLPNQNVAKAATEGVNIQEILNTTATNLVKNVSEMTAKDGAFSIVGLARSGVEVSENIFEEYYSKVESQVLEEMKKTKPFATVTDLEKIVIAVTSIGKDPTNVAGHDLINMIWQRENLGAQGINAYVYGLIALDTNNYKEPVNSVNTRESIIKSILDLELANGGFNFSKIWGGDTPDADITGMAMQALSKYIDKPEVKASIDRAKKIMSDQQNVNGGYIAWGNGNVEGTCQILIGLNTLGLDAKNEEVGFVKAEGDLLNFILSYYDGNGMFKAGFSGQPNKMTTEQAFYTLASYERLLNGKNTLYDMSDVVTDTNYEELLINTNMGISNLPKFEELSLDNKEEINGLLAKYSSLTEKYKRQVIGLEKLNNSKARIDELDNIVNILNNDIWNKINPSNITIQDKKNVLDIMSRYDKLSDKDKKYVNNYEDVLNAKAVIDELEKPVVEDVKEKDTSENKGEVSNSSAVKTSDNSNITYLALIMLTCGIVLILGIKKSTREAK